jgi:hypothetical protein
VKLCFSCIAYVATVPYPSITQILTYLILHILYIHVFASLFIKFWWISIYRFLSNIFNMCSIKFSKRKKKRKERLVSDQSTKLVRDFWYSFKLCLCSLIAFGGFVWCMVCYYSYTTINTCRPMLWPLYFFLFAS